MCADTGLTGFRRNRRPTEGVADRLLPRIRPREHLHGIVAAIGIKLLDAPVTGRLAVLVGGFRGMGEGGTIGAPAAIANALADALAPFGVEIFELPMTPERLFRLVKQAKARA